MPACSDLLVISMPGWEKPGDPLPDLDRGSTTGSATGDTSPIRAASSASTSRPVNMMSAAWLEPDGARQQVAQARARWR